MQIHEAGTGRHTAAAHHQIEGGEGIAKGRHRRQHRQLGLKHALLSPAQTGEAQIAEGCALAEGEPEAARQTHRHLGNDHADQQMQGRQLQDGEGQIEAHHRIALAEGRGQQRRQPEAPAPGQGGSRGEQRRPQGDLQGGAGPEQQRQQQTGRQAQEEQGGKVGQHRDAGDHPATEGLGDQIAGLDQQVGEAAGQQQQQGGDQQHQQLGAEAEQR